MEKIIWDDSYRIGISIIDTQHQQLFALLNRFVDAPVDNIHSQIISDTLSEMTKYCQYHFETEEQFMAGFEYPGLEEHSKEHDLFIKETVELCLETMEGDEDIMNNIFKILSNWLKNHILISDMKYKEFLAQKGIDAKSL